MKHKTLNIRVLITLFMLLITVICVTNVTYSYFTSSASTNGDITFGNLQLVFEYKIKNVSTPKQLTNSKKLSLEPIDGLIQRETAFGVKILGEADELDYLRIYNTSSTDCYLRFWIDAYIVNTEMVDEVEIGVVDKTINYGKYFHFPSVPSSTSTISEIVRKDVSKEETSPAWYFIKSPLSQNSYVELGKTLILKDNSVDDVVPLSLLGENIKITVSYEAVQTTNEAFKSVFDDGNYHPKWE